MITLIPHNKIVLIAIILSVTSCKSQEDEIVFIPYSVEIREKGSFIQKSGHELKSPEAKIMLKGACMAIGCNDMVEKVAEKIMTSVPLAGPNYRITGSIVKQEGEAWYFTFPGPGNYYPCSAALEHEADGTAIIGKNKGDSLQANFRENRVDGYAVVPRNRPEGHWVFAKFVVKYVKNGIKDPTCKPFDAPIFNCGPNSQFGDDCRQLM